MDFGDTQYIDHKNGNGINLIFPGELLTDAAEQLGLNVRNLTVDNVKKLFTTLTGKWLAGSITTEDLSSIANYFLSVIKYEDEELSGRLMDASELSYYIRHTNHESGEPLHGFVTRIREYHGKLSAPK
jgi:hypothetical protein